MFPPIGVVTEDYRRAYLFLYNLFQFVGFLYILIVMTIRYLKSGPDSMNDTYKVVGMPFKFCQALQILEIIHPMLKFTGGSPFMPFVQVLHVVQAMIIMVGGRLFITFAMIDAEPRMHSKPVVFYIFLIYSLAEIVRYPYYMLKTYNYAVDCLTWLRYTLWIVLYPLGFLCEGVIILRNIPYFEETGRFSLSLPNALNFSFYFPTILRVYLLLGYFPALYFVMTYMRRQRQHILAPRHKVD
ncbi:PTPLAD1 [Cordylochernes scorpioides]|uniref:Very-long-chain (3R)-3-hydroxyacyl-CoA dehydratase n=1 Tax=Cordylochernes scorpioides TaxID=51811 RepID=A0ABY6JUZ8_9ARAC|nr:PTPLAD1 [Cordylochernes scorpioides]